MGKSKTRQEAGEQSTLIGSIGRDNINVIQENPVLEKIVNRYELIIAGMEAKIEKLKKQKKKKREIRELEDKIREIEKREDEAREEDFRSNEGY